MLGHFLLSMHKFWSLAFMKVTWAHLRSLTFLFCFFLANSSLLKRAERRMRGLTVFVSSRRIDWYATWPTWVMRDFDLRSNVDPIFQGHHAYSWRALTRRTCWCLNYVPSLLSSKAILRRKLFFVIFYLSWPLEFNLLKLGQFWRSNSEKSVQGWTICSCGLQPVIVFEIVAHLRRDVTFR